MDPIAFVLVALGAPIVATLWTLKAGPPGAWRGRFVLSTGLIALAFNAVIGGGSGVLALLMGGLGIALLTTALFARDRQIAAARTESSVKSSANETRFKVR